MPKSLVPLVLVHLSLLRAGRSYNAHVVHMHWPREEHGTWLKTQCVIGWNQNFVWEPGQFLTKFDKLPDLLVDLCTTEGWINAKKLDMLLQCIPYPTFNPKRPDHPPVEIRTFWCVIPSSQKLKIWRITSKQKISFNCVWLKWRRGV